MSKVTTCGIILWLGISVWLCPTLNAQPISRFKKGDTTDMRTLEVNRVLIIGNKRTRDRIIQRELTLQVGDTISTYYLPEVLKRDKNKIYNLRLFNTVTIRPIEIDENKIDLLIEVTERWYTFPSPIFELSDRNFNEWWQNYKHDFGRVNYGLRLFQYNFRGRNETVRLTAQLGFTRKFQLSYRIPNLGKSQKHGLVMDFEYGEPKNLAYKTLDHKLLFLQGRKTLKETYGAAVSYSYRRSFYETHSLMLEYRTSHVADTIVKLNPNYYLNANSSQRFGAISYSFNSEHRDVVAYPLTGYQFTGYISKIGLGLGDNVNIVESNVTYAKHVDLKKGFYLSNFSSLFYSTPNNQPYALFGALGYRKQLIRGYEIYVVEGPKFFLNKTTLKKRIFHRTWDFEDMPIDQFKHFPLAIYLKSYVDFGYVENYPYYERTSLNSALSNKWLTGFGTGLDVVTFYDTVFRFEYTFTKEKTSGFFFNIKKEF